MAGKITITIQYEDDLKCWSVSYENPILQHSFWQQPFATEELAEKWLAKRIMGWHEYQEEQRHYNPDVDDLRSL